MAALNEIPKPGSQDSVEPFLETGERLVSTFGPYHATSRRVILLFKSADGARMHELPYTNLESIVDARASDRRRQAIGAALAIAGALTLFAWFLIIPIVSVVMGGIFILQGSLGRPAYYQLKGHGMEGRDLHRWQVKRYGAGSFIASISAITGVEVVKS